MHGMFVLRTDATGVPSNQRVGIRLVNFLRIESVRPYPADCSVFPSGSRRLFSGSVFCAAKLLPSSHLAPGVQMQSTDSSLC